MRISFKARAALAAAMATLVVACGGPTPSGQSSSPTPSGPVSLRVTLWDGNKDHLAVFQAIADAYKQQHPEVQSITYDVLPFATYTQALTTQLAGGNAPDLGWIFESSAPDFLSSGTLLDLTPILKSTSGYQFDDLSPAAMKLWESGGKVFAYPFSTSPFGVFYNADMFRAAGIPTPDQLLTSGKWNWTDLESMMTKLVAANSGKWGLIARDWDYKDWTNLAPIYRGFGADAWSSDGTKCTFADKPMVDAMTYISRLIFSDKVMPPPGVSADFFAGDSAMTITQISRASLLKNAGFKWGLVPLPAGPAANAQVIGQAGFGVFKQGAHPQAAAQFLAFLSNPENARKLAAFYPPPRKSLLTSDVLAQANPMLTPQQLQSVVVDGIKTGAVKPSHRNFQQVYDAVRSALDPLWQPNANVTSVLKSVCTTEQPLLK